MMAVVTSKINKILKENNLIIVEDYAEKKGLSPWYVRKLCRENKVKCHKVGSFWLIEIE